MSLMIVARVYVVACGLLLIAKALQNTGPGLFRQPFLLDFEYTLG
jgi:hypothetical protein